MEGILLFIFVALAVILMLVGVLKGYRWITVASAIPWALTAFFSYNKYGETGDMLWEILALFGLMMFLAAGAMSISSGTGGADGALEGDEPRYLSTRKRLKNRLRDD